MGLCSNSESSEVVLRRQLSTVKRGHYTWSCVWGYRKACYRAIQAAEAERGSPAYHVDIARQWSSMIPMLSIFHLNVGLQDLYRNDEVLTDLAMERYTTNPAHQNREGHETEYELYSDRVQRVFPGYVLDQRLHIRPGPETPRVDFNWLRELLLSTDLERDAELEWIDNCKGLRFLQDQDLGLSGNQVVFQSMPRTGNSFLRKILETVTGIYTGSDMNLDLTIHITFNGRLAGEETVSQDNLVWITKTHWPIESPLGATKFSAQKAITIVRNPIDAIQSMAYLGLTQSHSKVLQTPPSELDPRWWNTFCTKMVWATNEALVVNRRSLHPQIPVYYVRYEDLVLNPEPVLRELFAYILSVDSIEGTIVEKRISDYVAKGSTSASVYKLKADPRANLSRNRGQYTDAQIEYFKQNCREFLYYFKYCSHPDEDQADSSTTFFDYAAGEHDEEKLKELFGGYLQQNASVLARATEPTMNRFHFNQNFPIDPNMKMMGKCRGELRIKE